MPSLSSGKGAAWPVILWSYHEWCTSTSSLKSLGVKAKVIAAVKAFQTCKTLPRSTLNLCKLCCVLVPDHGSVTQTIPASDFIDSPVAETTWPTITAPCIFVNARLFSVKKLENVFKSDLFLHHFTHAKAKDSPKLSLEWINQGSSVDKENRAVEKWWKWKSQRELFWIKASENKFPPHLNLSVIPQFNINTANHTWQLPTFTCISVYVVKQQLLTLFPSDKVKWQNMLTYC